MKKLFFISIFLLSYQLFAQKAHFFIKGGVDYNFITAGAINRVGYEKNKYLFSGYLVGFGFISEDSSVDFDYADLKTKAKLNGRDSDLKISIFTISLLIGRALSYPLAGGIRADMNIGFSSSNVYGTLSLGPEIGIFLTRNIGFYAAGMLNLGIISQSAKINDIPERSSGLSSGPEIKTGIKIIF